MNPTELKMISKYMELRGLEMTGLAMIPEKISEIALFTLPEMAVVLSDGNAVVAVSVREAERNAELEAIKENFETIGYLIEDNILIIKIF